MAKRPRRVHVDCVTAAGFRQFKHLIKGSLDAPIARMADDGAVTVLRPDRFRHVLDATECRVVEQLSGARRR